MAEAKKQKTQLTPKARLSYPHLFKPAKIPGAEVEKFQATLLFDGAAQKTKQYKAMEQMVEDAIEAKWGSDRPRKLKLPFLTIDDLDKVPDGYTEDHTFTRLNSTSRPSVVDQNVNPITDPNDIYAGCYVRASITCYAWEHKTGGKGVSFGLNNVQFMEKGDKFGGGTKAEDDFDAVEDDDDLM